MADIGIYVVSRIAAAFIGSVAGIPGGTSLPERPLVSTDGSGYEFTLKGDDGSDYGSAVSNTPLRVDLDRLPPHFINAVIAAEDKRFLRHPGVDPFGAASAIGDTIFGRARGGSGLAQQMVKNTMVGSDLSISRKAVEAMLAVRSIHDLGHREVLRRYLQTAWFGRGRTGVMSAPEIWFGKDWQDVTLSESAILASMLKGPSRYDPWRNPAMVKARRDSIIAAMLDEGWITEAEAEEATSSEVTAIAPPAEGGDDLWTTVASRRELASLGLSGKGNATVTIDAGWQEISGRILAESVRDLSGVVPPRRLSDEELTALEAMGDGAALPFSMHYHLPFGSAYSTFALLSSNENGWSVLGPSGRIDDVQVRDPHPGWSPSKGELVTGYIDDEQILRIRLKTEIEGAIIALDPRNGEVIATIGGVDPNLTWFDRTQAIRSPGSAIKPFLYLAALDMGFGPQSPVQDRDITYRSGGQSWRPRNYDRRALGQVPLHTALERSLNMATVWLADRIGIEAMANVAEAAGVYSTGGMVRLLPSAIGSSDTTLADLVSGFAAIVNDAMPRKRHVIREIGRDGAAPYVPVISTGSGPIASPAAANDLLGILRAVTTRGTASVAMKQSPVMMAGKTGTSQSHKDAWFIAVTPHIAIGVWLGRDDSKPLPGRTTGGTHAAPITARIMSEALEAGLIDESGFRDERMTSGSPWPPDAHANLPRERRESIDVSSGEPASDGDALDRALAEALGQGRPAAPLDIDGFWVLSMISVRPAPDKLVPVMFRNLYGMARRRTVTEIFWA